MKKIGVVITLSCTLMFGGIAAEADTKEICPGPIPKDWVLVNTRVCAGCCTAGQLSTMLIVENTGKMEVGSTISICPESDIPAGWAVIRTVQKAGGCGKAGKLITIRTIEKLSDRREKHTKEEREI